MTFRVILRQRVRQRLGCLPQRERVRYQRSFRLLAHCGPSHRSLRTHRYRVHGRTVWGSSASMALRFFWRFSDRGSIVVVRLDSH